MKSYDLRLEKYFRAGYIITSPDYQGVWFDSRSGRWFIGIQKTSPKVPHEGIGKPRKVPKKEMSAFYGGCAITCQK